MYPITHLRANVHHSVKHTILALKRQSLKSVIDAFSRLSGGEIEIREKHKILLIQIGSSGTCSFFVVSG